MLIRCAGVAIALAGVASAQAPACLGTWSAPSELHTTDGRRVYVDKGSITVFKGRTYAFGTPTIEWHGRDAIVPADTKDTTGLMARLVRMGAVFDASGTVTHTLPAIPGLGATPQLYLIGSDSSSRTFAIELADVASRGARHIAVTKFDGTSWSQPDTILHGQTLVLGDVPVGRPGSQWAPSFGLLDLDSTGWKARVVRQLRRGWSTATLNGIRAPNMLLTYDRAGTVAGLVHGTSRYNSGFHSIFGAWLGNEVNWRQPQLVERTTSASFGNPIAALLGRDSVLAAWSISHDNENSVLSTALSLNAGMSWTLLPPPANPPVVFYPSMTVDAAGNAHLIFLGADASVFHSMWHRGEWTAPVKVSAEPALPGPPDVGPTADGGIVVKWSMMTQKNGGMEPYSIIARWTPGCRR